jgi:hypothetical protein
MYMSDAIAPNAQLRAAVQPIADAASAVTKDVPANEIAAKMVQPVQDGTKAAIQAAPELQDKSKELAQLAQETHILDRSEFGKASFNFVVKDSPIPATLVDRNYEKNEITVIMTSAAYNERNPNEAKAEVMSNLAPIAVEAHRAKPEWHTGSIDKGIAEIVGAPAVVHNLELQDQDKRSTIDALTDAVRQKLGMELTAALEIGNKLLHAGTSGPSNAERIKNLNGHLAGAGQETALEY